MSIPDERSAATENALTRAHLLVDYGVPVFRGRIKNDGNPDTNDRRWRNWQNTEPSHAIIDSWRPGEALCAVTGHTFDVLDIDPRNGGLLSFKRLSRELGEDGPEVYWEVSTPSGGRHLYIAGLGIGKHTGFLKGLDLQGGSPNGSGRGFVFLPPTVRVSKITGELSHYRARSEPVRPSATDTGCELLRDYINESLGGGLDKPYDIGRTSAEELRRDCIVAEAGEQRPALLRFVHELERLGVSESGILTQLVELCAEMPCYNEKDPWYPARGRRGRPDWHLRGLLHRRGTVIPDATKEEMEELEDSSPRRSGLIQWVQEIDERALAWLWYGRLAFGEMTLLDGAKGKGKSFITYDIIARATRGLAMPGEDMAECGPITVLLFTDEGGWDTTIRPRLRAAGADLTRIARVSPEAVRKEWGFPNGAKRVGNAIRECDARLAIFDPITDMLNEDIQTHNDASVRRALGPMAAVLNDTGCAGLAIRHFNKMAGAGARNRGSGSTAFQNRARVHMITGELPDGREDKFGIAIVDTNLTSKKGIGDVWGYNITDSDILTGDRQGSYHGRIEWGGIAEGVTPDILADGEAVVRSKGSNTLNEVTDVMSELFLEKDTWGSNEVMEFLQQAGVSVRKDVVARARTTLGIRAVAVRKKGMAGVQSWNWTTKKAKVREEDDDG